MLVLHVSLNATSDQELDYRFFVTAASDMKRCGQLRINEVGFGTGTLQKKHNHIRVTQLSALV